MSTHKHPVKIQVRSAGSGSLNRAKAVAFETAQTLSAAAGDVLFAYATTGSAMSCLLSSPRRI